MQEDALGIPKEEVHPRTLDQHVDEALESLGHDLLLSQATTEEANRFGRHANVVVQLLVFALQGARVGRHLLIVWHEPLHQDRGHHEVAAQVHCLAIAMGELRESIRVPDHPGERIDQALPQEADALGEGVDVICYPHVNVRAAICFPG